jgi:transcriptional regulator with GAF, ATPase, and Fis domain
VDRLNDSLLGPFKQRELNLLAVLANSAAVAIVEAQRSVLLEENRQLRDQLRPSPGSERVISQSREMHNIMGLLAKVGGSPATVLFMGETGTGKGLLAQVVHEISGRRDRPFVQVNCAALPESLLESELFGHVQGAFTGASRDKSGPVRGGRGRDHLPRRDRERCQSRSRPSCSTCSIAARSARWAPRARAEWTRA